MKDTPKQRTPGAPRGNRNALRHGLKSGQFPKDAKFIEVRLNVVRRNLEDAVVRTHGSVSEEHACYIQTAIRWEGHAAKAQRWLTKEDKNLTVSEKLQFSREIATASANRDRAISMLELGTAQATTIDAICTRIERIESKEQKS
jgi:hypothetical protein